MICVRAILNKESQKLSFSDNDLRNITKFAISFLAVSIRPFSSLIPSLSPFRLIFPSHPFLFLFRQYKGKTRNLNSKVLREAGKILQRVFGYHIVEMQKKNKAGEMEGLGLFPPSSLFPSLSLSQVLPQGPGITF